MICEPQICARPEKCTSIHLPKREELLLRTVLALPKASRMGLADSSLSAMPAVVEPAASAKNLRHCFVASVLPAPLSPEMMMAWSLRSVRRPKKAAAATWKMCGCVSSPICVLKYCMTSSLRYTFGIHLKGLMDTRMVPIFV